MCRAQPDLHLQNKHLDTPAKGVAGRRIPKIILSFTWYLQSLDLPLGKYNSWGDWWMADVLEKIPASLSENCF